MVALRLHRKAYKIICFVALSLVIVFCITISSFNHDSDLSTSSQLKETIADVKNSFQQAGVSDFLKIPSNLVKWGSDKFVSEDSKDASNFIEDELESDKDVSSAKNYGYDYGEQFKKNVETIWKGLFTPIYYIYSVSEDSVDGEPQLLYPTKSDGTLEDYFTEDELAKFDGLLDMTKDYEKMFKTEQQKAKDPIKACFMSLVRNEDLYSILPTIRKIEDRFNKNYHYSYVFFNDIAFTEEFKAKTKRIINPESEVHFVTLPKEMWSYPDFIDLNEAAKTREKMKDIIYGSSESYRHMCRFNSKWFYQHPIMDQFDYYWRIEPDTAIYCDMDYDLFEYMNDNKLVYGFSISLHEY